VHFLLKSYAIFNATLGAVQTAKQSLVMEIFLGHLKVGILLRVEYQSCAERYNSRARRNSAFLHKRRENYGVFGECRSAAWTARWLPANCLLRACKIEIRCEGKRQPWGIWDLASINHIEEYFVEYVVGYEIFGDYVAAIVMWMHKWAFVMHVYTGHCFLSKIMVVCLIKARISDGGTHA
jgi:hypothetical protein